jgi:proton-coupled amino acid transporter
MEEGDNEKVRADPLISLPLQNDSPSTGVNSKQHLKTYTAGEDKSRLAAAARELGLAAQLARRPRRQVRNDKGTDHRRRGSLSNPANVLHLLLETTTEDARMRAIYSSHGSYSVEEDYQLLLHSSMPLEFLDTLDEEGEEGQDFGGEEGAGGIDAHGGALGGDLTSAVLGIIKGMVGPAILYLPHGFANAGWLVAIPIMMVCTVLFLYSSSCLLESWKYEDDKVADTTENTALLLNGGSPTGKPRNRRQMLSYPELAYRALGPIGESVVKAGIALMQSGVCLTYLIFVPQNLHTSMLSISSGRLDVSPKMWLIVMIVIQIPLSWIRDIRKLTPTNLLANCLILYGLMICLGYAMTESATTGNGGGPVRNTWDHFTDLTPFAQDWFLFIGTSVS